jgi:RNA polymerase sigma factor (sigma-70 family)
MAMNPDNAVMDQLRRAVLRADGSGLTDGQLLDSFLRRRDEAAFEALVRRHGPMVLGVCRRVLRHEADAEDAFQATFLVLVHKAASIRAKETVAAWLYRVAHRAVFRARALAARRREREKPMEETVEPAAAEPAPGRDLQLVIDQELDLLPERYRVPIVLCDLGGKTRKEVAGQLGWPEGTVSSRLARARALLARRLTRRGVVLSAGTMAAVLCPKAASAGVPAALVLSTVKAAGLFAAGKAAGPGVISAPVAALMAEVLKAMLLTKLKLAAVAVLALGIVLAGAAVTTQALKAGQDVKAPAAPTAPIPPQDRHEPVRADDPKVKPLAEPPAKDSKVRALLEEKLALTRELAEAVQQLYKSSAASREQLLQANLRVFKAELDLCETDNERIAVYEKMVAAYKEMEEQALQLQKSGQAQRPVVIEARLNRLEAQIALERLKAKEGAPPK